MDRIKQVILIRKDLKMRRGKEIAQGSHASMSFLTDQIKKKISEKEDSEFLVRLSDEQLSWLKKGAAKVCLRVNSEKELLEYHQKAKDSGLISYLIMDSGRTEFGGTPTYTACSIGPHFTDKIDKITSELVPY